LHFCDSNTWLALTLSDHLHHRAVAGGLRTINARDSILFCRATQQSFLRLLTTAAVLAPYGNPPLTNSQAWAAYEALPSDDRIVFRAEDPPGLEEHWKRFALRSIASPNLWTDAYLAAFAVSSGCRMITTDRAFSQFAGLDLVVLG